LKKKKPAKPGWPSISGTLKKRSCEQAPKARHALLTFCTGNYKPENHTGKPMNHLQKWTRALKSKEFSTDDQIRVAVILWLSMPACQTN